MTATISSHGTFPCKQTGAQQESSMLVPGEIHFHLDRHHPHPAQSGSGMSQAFPAPNRKSPNRLAWRFGLFLGKQREDLFFNLDLDCYPGILTLPRERKGLAGTTHHTIAAAHAVRTFYHAKALELAGIGFNGAGLCTQPALPAALADLKLIGPRSNQPLKKSHGTDTAPRSRFPDQTKPYGH